MPSDQIVLSSAQYEALLGWAKSGASASGESGSFYALRKTADRENLIQRYTLVIVWDTLPQRPAPGVTDTPKGKTKLVELTRKPTREDVLEMLKDEETTPGLVWVTADPRGVVGFYELDQYPF